MREDLPAAIHGGASSPLKPNLLGTFDEESCRSFLRQVGEDVVPFFPFSFGIEKVYALLLDRYGRRQIADATSVLQELLEDQHNADGIGDDGDVWRSWRFHWRHRNVSLSFIVSILWLIIAGRSIESILTSCRRLSTTTTYLPSDSTYQSCKLRSTSSKPCFQDERTHLTRKVLGTATLEAQSSRPSEGKRPPPPQWRRRERLRARLRRSQINRFVVWR